MSTPTIAVASSVASPSVIIAVAFKIGDGSVVTSSSLINTDTPSSFKKGFVASRMSSADLKWYLPKELNLDFLDLNLVWISINFSFNVIGVVVCTYIITHNLIYLTLNLKIVKHLG